MKKILLSAFLIVSIGYFNQSRAQGSDVNTVITNYVAAPNSASVIEIRTVHSEGKDEKIVVYPNPSMDGKVNISFNDASELRDVFLTDISGQVVKQWKGVSYNNITIVNLKPGMYTIKVVWRSTGEQTEEKITVNKQ